MSSLFKTVAENAPAGLILFRKTDKRVVFMNRSASHMLGYDPSDSTEAKLSSLEASDLLPNESVQSFRVPDLEVLNIPGYYSEIRILSKQKQMIPIQAWIEHRIIRKSEYIVLHLQSLASQKRLLREMNAKQEGLRLALHELQQQNDELRELALTKIKFIALVSHELRNPLNGLLGSVELLNMNLWRDEKDLLEIHQTLKLQVHTLIEYVRNILDYSRLEAKSADYYVEKVRVFDLIDNSVSLLSEVCSAREIEIVVDKNAKRRSAWFWADGFRSSQVLNNILSNAVKFSPNGSKIEILVSSNKGHTTVEVRDYGCGIPPGMERKVFAEFERVDDQWSAEEGHGLGMAISQRIVNDLGGKIWYESELGKGTRFFFQFPKKRLLQEDLYKERPQEDQGVFLLDKKSSADQGGN